MVIADRDYPYELILQPSHDLGVVDHQTFEFHHVTEKDILKLWPICHQTNKASGYHKITARDLKDSFPISLPIITDLINPRTYRQSHTPTVVQGGVFDMFMYFETILPSALLEACDVTKHSRHLGRHIGFY